MSDAKQMRLSKVAKEFNLSLGKIVEFLASKGHSVENNPNAKIGDSEYLLLSKEFSSDKNAKQEALHVGLTLNKVKRESIVLEDPKVVKAREEEELRAKELELAAIKAAEEKKKKEEEQKNIIVEAPVQKKVVIEPIEEIVAEPTEIQENTGAITGPKVLGKLDLSALNQKTKPDKKSKKEAEAAEKATKGKKKKPNNSWKNWISGNMQ